MRQFFSYAVPTLLAGWVYITYTIVDGIFIGRYVGAPALAALNLLVPVLYLPYALSVMIGIGGATLVSRLLGQGRGDQARAAFTQALWMILLVSLAISPWLYFDAGRLMVWLGGSGQLTELGAEYLRACAWFTLFGTAGFALEVFLRAEGAARFGLYCMLGGAVLNGLLDYLLIVVWQSGMAGAAWATGISQGLAAVSMFAYHLWRARDLYPIRRAFAGGWMVARMAYNGASELLAEVAPALTVLVFNRVILAYLGEDGLVAYAVLEYMTMAAVVTMVALVQSSQPMISYYRGSGNRRALHQSFMIGLTCTVALSLLVAAAMVFLSGPLAAWFLPGSPHTWSLLDKAVFWYALAFIPAGVNLAVAGYLTAIEAPGPSAVIALLRSLVLMLGLLWIFSQWLGADGIWLTLLGTELGTLGFSIWLYRRFRSRAVVSFDRAALGTPRAMHS